MGYPEDIGIDISDSNQKKLCMFLEKNMWPDELYKQIQETCRKLGIEYQVIKFVECFDFIPQEMKDKMSSKLDSLKGNFVFPYGCLNFVHNIKNSVEGVFWNDKFNVKSYLTHWHKHMINKDGFMTTYGILKSNWQYFIFNERNEVFIRPDSNNKIFTGKVYSKETFEKDIRHMGYSFEVDFIDPEELVWIFPTRKITKEYRFAIVDGKVITSTLYNKNGLNFEKAGCPDDVLEYAQAIASDSWQPETMYTLDIGVVQNVDKEELGVLEIGSLNCSGWYSMDVEKIIVAINQWVAEYNKGVNHE